MLAIVSLSADMVTAAAWADVVTSTVYAGCWQHHLGRCNSATVLQITKLQLLLRLLVVAITTVTLAAVVISSGNDTSDQTMQCR